MWDLRHVIENFNYEAEKWAKSEHICAQFALNLRLALLTKKKFCFWQSATQHIKERKMCANWAHMCSLFALLRPVVLTLHSLFSHFPLTLCSLCATSAKWAQNAKIACFQVCALLRSFMRSVALSCALLCSVALLSKWAQSEHKFSTN